MLSSLLSVSLLANQILRLGPDLRHAKAEIALAKTEIDRANAEIEKLKGDEVSLAADVLLKLQNARSRYDATNNKFANYSSDLVRLIESKASCQSIDLARESACELLQESITDHVKYVEFVEVAYKYFPAKLEDFILDDLCTSLGKFVERIQIINTPRLIELTGADRSQISISAVTAKPYYRVSTELPEGIRETVNERLHPMIKRLLNAGAH